MHSFGSLISSYFLNSLWMTPLLWASGRLACLVTKRLGRTTTHRIWVLVLFAAVIMPSLPIATAALRQSLAEALWTMRPTLRPNVTVMSTLSHDSARILLPHRLFMLLSFLYIGLLIGFGVRLLRSALLTSGMVRRARRCVLPPPHECIRQEMARCFSVAPLLLETKEVQGPVTVGVFHPVLLLPAGFLEATELDDFRVAVAHECVHIARHDFLKHLCYQCLSLPIAFHPFSWFIKNQIAQDRELICDQVAVQRAVESRVYIRSLLRLAMLMASGAPTVSFNAIGINDANILEERVMELRTAKPAVTPRLRLGLLTLGLIGISAAAFAGVAAPIASAGIEAAQNGHGTKVFHVGKDVSAPVLVREAPPEFPANYKKQTGKMSGTCVVALVVDAAGTPREVHVVRSFDQAFDQEAMKAVQEYRFKPGLHAGKPVPVDIRIEVNFQTF